MRATRWRERFFASTRGRIVVLLRRGPLSVSELARAVGLTDNALRGHLATLERDGLVEPRGVRRGQGKPAGLYGLTHGAEALFPQGYALVLGSLLDALADRLPLYDRDALLEEAGRRTAAHLPPAAGDARARLESAAAALAELGGLAEVEEEDGRLALRAYGCPFGRVVPGHPEVCRLAAALLRELTALPIVERCPREGTPRCRFEVEATPSAG